MDYTYSYTTPERSFNLLIVSRCPPWPLHMGDSLILYHLARTLKDGMHNIDLCAFYNRPTDLADVTFYNKFFRDVELLREPERAYGERRFFRGARFPKKAGECWSPTMWEKIAEKIAEERYDVVHFFGGIAVYEYYELVKQFPTVITPYESYSLYLEREAAQSSGGSFFARTAARTRLAVARNYESWMYTPFDRTVVVSKKDAGALRKLNDALKLVIIPNGVQIEKFSPSPEESASSIVLFTGNFSYPPNLDAAMILAKKIFPAVRKYVPDARLMLVGANPPPALVALGERQDAITVTGKVPDMRVYLNMAAVYVSPLRRGAGIKNKILEAMAMAKPVVATPLSCDGIGITPGEDVIIAKKIGQIAKQTVMLLKNPERRQQIGAAARGLIQSRYTWRRVAGQYENLYRRVIEEHKTK